MTFKTFAFLTLTAGFESEKHCHKPTVRYCRKANVGHCRKLKVSRKTKTNKTKNKTNKQIKITTFKDYPKAKVSDRCSEITL